VLNARIRKRFLTGKAKIAVIGPDADFTYKYQSLGANPSVLSDIASGAHAFADVLKKAAKPMIIVGSGAVARTDGAAILAAARAVAESCGLIKDGWNGFNILHRAASRVGGLDLGFVPGQSGKGTRAILDAASSGEIEIVYLLGADEIDMKRLGKAFVIYQGHHGDAGAARADVILPGAAYTEKDGIYVNTEGRVQRALRAVFPVGDARDDWAILRALSERLGKKLPFDTIEALQTEMTKAVPHLGKIDETTPASWGAFGTQGSINGGDFTYPVDNYYMTDPIGRASITMAKCIAEILGQGTPEGTPRTGTHG
jgi:NADH-quinone oxidoreductase subunit G